jgi:hypothetical protein
MAGPLDLTGQNIESTYQRILQISGSSVYNGTGSLVTIANAVTSSYPITVTGSSLYSTAPVTSNISNNGVVAFGSNAGNNATNAASSIFIGNNAGQNASLAAYSNFLGAGAGLNATNAFYSNFLGANAGNSASGASYSNFFGFRAGYGATGAGNSNFLGANTGEGASNALNSNFLGQAAGYYAVNAANSNFLGNGAGQSAIGAAGSNFLGSSAGREATNAANSNFLGTFAGRNATDAANSNFIGQSAGYSASNALNSNFLGSSAGYNAANAEFSNFLGSSTGLNAINASYSNFLGTDAGRDAAITNYSIFIGHRAGINYSDKTLPSLGDGVGPNNIIIGNNITLEQNRIDSINIGAIIFATGSYAQINDESYAFSGSAENGKVGINVVDPQYALDVSGSINFTGNITQNGTPYGRPYKVYTALLTQSGGDNVQDKAVGDFITLGITYYINTNSENANLTVFGAPNSNVGTSFVCTQSGTLPIIGSISLLWNEGAPVVTVLENTIGDVWFTYSSPGRYQMNNIGGLFTISKTTQFLNGLTVEEGSLSIANTIDPDILYFSSADQGFTATDGLFLNTPIEIRVYN